MNHKNTLIFLLFCILTACTGNEHQMSLNYWEEGKKHEEMQRYDSATFYYRKALDLLKGKRDYELKGKIYNTLGNLFLHTDLYVNAYEAFGEAIENNSKLTDKTAMSESLRGRGKSFLYRKLADSAACYFLDAYALSGQIKDKKEICLINNNLSSVYYTLGKYDKASFYNEKALALSKDSTDLYMNWLAKSDILVEYRQYDSAWHYLNLVNRSNSVYTRAVCYLSMAQLAGKQQLPDSSKYLKLFTIYNDSLEKLDQSNLVQSTDHQYLLDKNMSREKRKYIIGFLVCSFLVLYLIIRHKIKIKREKKKLQDEQKRFLSLCEEMRAIQNELALKKEQEKNIIEQEEKYKRLSELHNNIVSTIQTNGEKCTKNFRKHINYYNVKRILKADPSLMTTEEKKHILDTALKIYEPFINKFSAFTDMNLDERYLCGLARAGFNTKEISILRNATWVTVRYQKSRLKKKHEEALQSLELFELIFGKKDKEA